MTGNWMRMTNWCYIIRSVKLSLLECNGYPQEKAQAKKQRSAFSPLWCHSFFLPTLGVGGPWKFYYLALVLEPPAVPFLSVQQKPQLPNFATMLNYASFI